MAQTRASTRKFLFDRSFDDPSKLYLPGERRKSEIAAEEAAEAAIRTAAQAMEQAQVIAEAVPPPPKPEFTQAQLDAAREEGYIQGHTAALEEAATAREHYTADAMNLIAQGLVGLEEQQQAANREIADFAMRMVYGVVRRVLPPHAEAHAIENVEGFVRQILPLAVGEPRLVVRAHPMIAEDLDVRLKEIFARGGFQGSFTVVTDYEVQPGDCRLEWDGGGADRDEGRIWREIRDVIAGNFGDVDVDALDAAADQAAMAQPEQETQPEDQ